MTNLPDSAVMDELETVYDDEPAETEYTGREITNAEILKKLDKIELLAGISAKTMLDTKEAAAFVGYSERHLYQLTCKRLIPYYKHGRLRFDKRELEAWLKEKRVKTQKEIESEAETYITVHSKIGRRK